MVPLYAQLGVRQIHFAYNRNNSVADGCHDLPRGLTPLGHRMVAAVNDAGILMDCAHTGRLCSLDIMNGLVAARHLQPRQSLHAGAAWPQRHR
jgi:membrane dipeptidase